MTEFVHFTVDGDRLALILEEVREIAQVSRATPVPRSPASIRGLANIRGRVVTLLDAEVLYGLRPPEGAAFEAPGQAVVFAAPRDHLALFTRSRVDIGRGQEADLPAEAPVASTAAAPSERPRAPLGRLVLFGNGVVHLIPTEDLAAHCEDQVFERYRRRV
jgi:chemotaxis signal transduction protein